MKTSDIRVKTPDQLKEDVLQDFFALWPEKFGNKTNGVTPRRWIALSNPRLASLVSEAIDDGWITRLDELKRLEPLAHDAAFGARWREVKRANKEEFAAFIRQDIAKYVKIVKVAGIPPQ